MNKIEYVQKEDFRINDDEYKELINTLKEEHNTYLLKYNISLPSENTAKFLWLIFLRKHILKFVHKDTISSFVATRIQNTGKDQQVRHLAADGFYVLNRGEAVPIFREKVPSGYHCLFSMENPKPTYLHSVLKRAGRLSAQTFEQLKIVYDNKCATCGCEEGKPHRYFPDTKVILEQGHMDPNKRLDLRKSKN